MAFHKNELILMIKRLIFPIASQRLEMNDRACGVGHVYRVRSNSNSNTVQTGSSLLRLKADMILDLEQSLTL